MFTTRFRFHLTMDKLINIGPNGLRTAVSARRVLVQDRSWSWECCSVMGQGVNKKVTLVDSSNRGYYLE